MTSRVLFPDTSVAVTFAMVDRIGLLATWLGNRGSFCDAVRLEMLDNAARYATIEVLIAELGEAVELTKEEADEAELVRRNRFGGSEAEPRKHLGEAHTLTLLRKREEYGVSTWISDDQDAVEFAERQRIRALDSVGVLIELVGHRELSAREALKVWQDMFDVGRGVPLPTFEADIRSRAGV